MIFIVLDCNVGLDCPQDEESRDSLSTGGAAEETHPGDVIHR